MNLTEASTDNRVLDMYDDYRMDGMNREDAILAIARNTKLNYDQVEEILQMYNVEENSTKNNTKNTELIKITEEVRIPKTDIILEKGDVIRVFKQGVKR